MIFNLCINCRAPTTYETVCYDCISGRGFHQSKNTTTKFITWDDEVTKKIDLNDLFKDKPKPEKNLCPHIWVEYIGLNEKFDFCKFCNQKKKS